MSKQNHVARHACNESSAIGKLTSTVVVTGGLVASLTTAGAAGAAPETSTPVESTAAATTPLALETVMPAETLVVAPVVKKASPEAKKSDAPAKVSRSEARRTLTSPELSPEAQAAAAERLQRAQERREAAAARAERIAKREAAAARQIARFQEQQRISRAKARQTLTAGLHKANTSFAKTVSSPFRSTGGAVGIASGLAGIPYVYGGSTLAGFDCSGFVSYVFAQLGVQLPHQSGAIKAMTTPVADPRPGDLVFLPGHVAIYAGDGMVYEARNYGSLSGKYPLLSGSTFGRL